MELLDITGVGPVTARLLTEAGIATVTSVADSDVSTLAGIRGIGSVSAESMKADAVRLVGTTEPGPAGDSSTPPSARERRGKDLRKRAKNLHKQAKQLTKKAKSARSKKNRKRLAEEAARLEKAARKARRRAKKLLSG
jgi:Holliday junction resolvasome RuvABC DNA-binding subunit